MSNGIIHDFHERLAFSQAMGAEEVAWVQFYQEAFPEHTLTVRIDAQSKYQEWGIDRHIYMPGGKILAIDEKVRDPEKAKDRDGDPYDDILIEEFSVWMGDRHPRNKIGWSLDPRKRCDHVAYAIPLVGKCYLLPFDMLRLACRAHLNDWKTCKDRKGRRCYPLDARNRDYVTRNCGVTWERLSAAMTDQMKRVRAEGVLSLPVPVVQKKQAVFEWGASGT